MRYLKLFEAYGISDNIYYLHQLEDVINENWNNISTTRDTIKFNVGDKNYAVYFEGFCDKDDLMLEETAKDKFIEKFKIEFAKKPREYLDNFKKKPKILGNIYIYLDSEKYNL